MISFRLLAALVLSFTLRSLAVDDYELGPDSKPQSGVPKGEVLKFSFESSKIFPGTYRDYSIYIPAQYTPDKPACLYVNQDGIQWQAPTVFDNLIHKKEMPVTIGVFIMHGRVKAADTNSALDRFNRSYEYDGVGDNYARFLLTELLPEVATKKTSDGRPIRFSTNANDHAIGGSSSGAVCAFTAAWERPDAFSRVFSVVGTYVGLRGADRYPTLIRKYEPKPLRIFLQDGTNDLNIYAGDWWMANQSMQRALDFSGYEVNHIWGDGAHNGKHGSAIFPDAMRWLWKDWPQSVKKGESKNTTLSALLISGEDWKEAWHSKMDCVLLHGLAANDKGELIFDESAGKKQYRLASDGTLRDTWDSAVYEGGKAFGPDGRLYALGEKRVEAYTASRKHTTVAGLKGASIVVRHNGDAYVGDTSDINRGKIWLIHRDGKKNEADVGPLPLSPKAITLSPDQTLLYVADSSSHWVYAYQIQGDGSLAAKQKFFWLHGPEDAPDAGIAGLCTDREGRLYVATRMGIQICDQAGKVQCILPTPNGYPTDICFGGENFDTLYAISGNSIFKRKLKTQGAQAWAAPIKPAAPRL